MATSVSGYPSGVSNRSIHMCAFVGSFLVALGLLAGLLYVIVSHIALDFQTHPKLLLYQMESATVSESPSTGILEWNMTLVATNPNRSYRINFGNSVGMLYYGETQVGDALYFRRRFTLKRKPAQKRFDLKFQVHREWFQNFVASDNLSDFELRFASGVQFRFWQLYPKGGVLVVHCRPVGLGFSLNNQTTLWTKPSDCSVQFVDQMSY